MKRTISFILSVLLILSLFAPAAGAARDPQVFRQMTGSELTTFDYLATGNNFEHIALSNGIEGLVDYDPYGNMIPGIATEWSANEDNTVWTFKIREGVKWVDAEGNEYADVTAHDFVTAAHYVNDANNDSATQYMYDGFVVNATEYYEGTAAVMMAENAVIEGEAANIEEYYTANEIDPSTFIEASAIGVKAVDDYTLEYTLVNPTPFFPTLLSYASYLPVNAAYLEEMGENFGLDNWSILYNGAYIISEWNPQQSRILTANPLYWDAERPYIPRLEWIYNAQVNTLSPTLFQNEELDYALIDANVLGEMLENPELADQIHPTRVNLDYSYFYAFNFEPRFDAAYEPDNWTLAVNNENFRQALMASLDRVKAMAVYDPYGPERMITNTVTPVGFTNTGGKDYTQYGALAAIAARDSFDEAKAVEYRDLAKAELEAAGATFPIKILMPFNPATANWDKECQVVEQQMEGVLGTDFIDIIVEVGPESGFLAEVRRSGKFAFMKCNWGADYADPQTFTDPFNYSVNGNGGSSYGFFHTDPQYMLDGSPITNKSEATQALVTEYNALLDAAKAETDDNTARFEAFAAAEAFLIEHAFIVPTHLSFEGYKFDMTNSFDAPYAPYGLPRFSYKNFKFLDKSMSIAEFDAAQEAWNAARAEALQ